LTYLAQKVLSPQNVVPNTSVFCSTDLSYVLSFNVTETSSVSIKKDLLVNAAVHFEKHEERPNISSEKNAEY
jgi:hypothetical protein